MGRAEERRARQKSARRAKRAAKPGGIRRFFTWKWLLGYVLGLCALFIGAFFVLYLLVEVPPANAAAKAEANVYKYSDGTIMAKEGKVNRESVPLSKIPKEVQHTFVAAENKDFYGDSGVSFTGTARGLINTALGRGKQGGSTITQQYVKNYYLSQEQTVSRKLKELVISLKVDRQKSKDYILAGYINTSYYGRGAYGIQAAARAYYDKDVEDLSVAQGAYLASVLQAPSQYDWSAAGPNGKRLVKARWNYVLNNMVEKDWLSKSEREGMKFDVPIEPRPIPGLDGQAGYFIKAAKDELFKAGVDEKEFEAGGWTVTLNIDKKKQKALEKAVRTELTSKLDPKKRKVDGDAQVGAVSVDPKSGGVVAMYGGAGATEHYFNNATREDYQPASTFKPLILAAGLENGSTTQDSTPITASTIYDGTSRRPVKGSDTAFAPPNEDNKSYGPISVQKAMNNSVNSVFAQMAVDVGLDKVKNTAIDLGMSKDAGGFDVRPAMSLGVMGASPRDMAGVYATLDNHGKKVTPAIVKSAEKGDERPQLPDPTNGQAISRGAADSVTSVLTGVVDDGTGQAVRQQGQAVAGKTGTSDDNKSAWFSGYTPDLVTSVGMFGEQKGVGKQVSLKGTAGGGRVNGGDFPARIWAAYTQSALSGQKASKFDLDTDMGAAVKPPAPPSSSEASESPSASPSASESASESPSSSPSASESTSESPSASSSASPSDDGDSPSPPDPSSSASGDDGGFLRRDQE
ncbi:transglycosylase domain-containing protein [Streptomyces iranensis]|uniref:Glycosyl transferase family 51 n=1 Tax=Streptomyces iranensis TaxID=576784 RepID=A0A060ZMP2_9ACTN|nr:transglycosylase domain-containing protein [Streptomyces iranensis]MBP2067250.1 membrane peptidoglycan carboxypeptidase [Streptomyces iranensis]CDR07030.1 glycosyl transferase family 51 [Streptomyces iranensis]